MQRFTTSHNANNSVYWMIGPKYNVWTTPTNVWEVLQERHRQTIRDGKRVILWGFCISGTIWTQSVYMATIYTTIHQHPIKDGSETRESSLLPKNLWVAVRCWGESSPFLWAAATGELFRLLYHLLSQAARSDTHEMHWVTTDHSENMKMGVLAWRRKKTREEKKW